MTAKKFDERKWEMKILSITKIEQEKEDTESTMYRLKAQDKDELNTVVIKSDRPFKGLSAKDGVITIILKNSQLSIGDFQASSREDSPEE